MNKVEAIADDDKRELIGKFRLEGILNFFWIVVIALTADSFNLADLASPSSGLDVLEVNLR
jgi:hypothetical protein